LIYSQLTKIAGILGSPRHSGFYPSFAVADLRHCCRHSGPAMERQSFASASNEAEIAGFVFTRW
jgi:hypothetical protein